MIHRKMANMGIKNRSAFLRKMALDGYIVNLDMDDIHEMIRLLRNTTNNLNQIAAKINAGVFRSYNFQDVVDEQKKIYEQLLEIVRKG